MAKTLGSLDPGWIERCQEFLEKTEEFPEKPKSATEKPKSATEKTGLATEKPKSATENPELAMENPEFLREKGEIPESLGNSARKRPREGGGAAEIPAKLRRGLREANLGISGTRENLGIFGMREIQEGNEDEGERSEFRSGAGKATKRSGRKVEEEEKSKPARKAR